MAEGFLRYLAGDEFEVHSAGTEATRVHPLAIQAMREIGIDISHHRSKLIDEFLNQDFDYVITVCDTAKETCPVFPTNKQQLHWSFDDPSQAQGTEEQRLQVFRRVRHGIEERIRDFIAGHRR